MAEGVVLTSHRERWFALVRRCSAGMNGTQRANGVRRVGDRSTKARDDGNVSVRHRASSHLTRRERHLITVGVELLVESVFTGSARGSRGSTAEVRVLGSSGLN
jgi:hypothetical protein